MIAYLLNYPLFVPGVFHLHGDHLDSQPLRWHPYFMSTVTIKLPKGCSSGIVATHSIRDRRVVAHGRQLKSVLQRARKAGAVDPVIMFVPHADGRYVY